MGIIVVLSIIGLVMLVPVVISTISLIFYLVFLIMFKIKEKIFKKELEIDVSYNLPEYDPAIAGYLVDCQRIGQKEVLTTLFDLVSRNVIRLVKGNNTFKFELNDYDITTLENFEECLILWLFKNKKEITSNDIKKELFDPASKKDMNFFLSKLQSKAKLNDFFSKKLSKTKEIICTIVTANSYIMNHIYKFSFYVAYAIFVSILHFFVRVSDWYKIFQLFDLLQLYYADSIVPWLVLVVSPLVIYIVNKGMNALLVSIFNIICYYNEYSENGYKEYCKLMGLKKYLETYSLIPEHPIEGIKTWDRYYLFAIELNCSDRFFKQLKENGISNSLLDLDSYEFYEFLISTIRESFDNPPKDVFTDVYGGSHVKY